MTTYHIFNIKEHLSINTPLYDRKYIKMTIQKKRNKFLILCLATSFIQIHTDKVDIRMLLA